MPGGWKREAWSSRISYDKLAAKLGLCQHVLPGGDENDGLAHLPFISGKVSLHPVYYELAGICLIVFASTTRLAEIKALLLLQTKHCIPLQGSRTLLPPGCPGRGPRMALSDTKQFPPSLTALQKPKVLKQPGLRLRNPCSSKGA